MMFMPKPWSKKQPGFYQRIVTEKIGKKKHGRTAKIATEDQTWIRTRGYAQYNALFSRALGLNIVDYLATIKRNRPLRILDDGAGKGHFLDDLKHLLLNRGINCETTAISLYMSNWLKIYTEDARIDKTIIDPAEYYAPEKSLDAIFSFFGSIEYSHDLIRKNHLLKYLYSLDHNGILLVGFLRSKILPGGKQTKEQYAKNLMVVEDQIIERLEKMGFIASFHNIEIPFLIRAIDRFSQKGGYPDTVLFVRRI